MAMIVPDSIDVTAHPSVALEMIVSYYGEDMIVDWLERRLAIRTPPATIEVGDTVRVLPRKPGDGEKEPCYIDCMTEFEGGCLEVIDKSSLGWFVLEGMPRHKWHPDWLEKVDG